MTIRVPVVRGDCVAVLRHIRDQSIDFIFADPPYNMQLGEGLTRANGDAVKGVNEAWDQFESFEAYDAFSKEWLAECRRVLKPTGSIAVIGSYHNIFRLGATMQTLGFWIQNDIIWRKTNPMPNFRGTRLQNAQETIVWASPGRGKSPVFNYKALKAGNDDRQLRSDWYIPICQGQERLRNSDGTSLHPTQKPLRLMERLITMATLPDAVILDPFAGTGTTGVAARRLGRQFLGIEADPDYAEAANARILATEPYAIIEPDEPPVIRYPTMGELLDLGALSPGDTLFSTIRASRGANGTTAKGPKETVAVTVLASGEITDGSLRGSIHSMAKDLRTGQSNGWLAWSLMKDGGLVLLDTIRKEYAYDPETGEIVSTSINTASTEDETPSPDRKTLRFGNAPSIVPLGRTAIR